MKIYDLWPTRVVVTEIPIEYCARLYETYAITNSKDYEVLFENNKDIENYIKEQIDRYYLNDYEFCDGWIRRLSTKENNDFGLHCDNHYGNQLVAVLQVFGDSESGGELNLFDPSWKNPQFVSDSKNSNVNKFTVPFIQGQLVIFPSNVWHSVNSYHGSSDRITLNLMVKRIK